MSEKRGANSLEEFMFHAVRGIPSSWEKLYSEGDGDTYQIFYEGVDTPLVEYDGDGIKMQARMNWGNSYKKVVQKVEEIMLTIDAELEVKTTHSHILGPFRSRSEENTPAIQARRRDQYRNLANYYIDDNGDVHERLYID